MYNPTADHPPTGITSWPRRAEAWLDAKGTYAWIAAMVLGFVFFWPVGLALVAYITWTNRWSSKKMFKCRNQPTSSWTANSSGNTAFDAYRDETIRRLEAEQDAFQAFLKRLRDAKDKQEFDAFMDDRAKASGTNPADAARDVAAY